MFFPEKIKKQDYIGVTATSAGLEDEGSLIKLESAIKNFTNEGFKIIETENVRMCDKLVSSNSKTRASEFLKLWEDDKVKYIILARGGEFLMDMLPYLNSEKIKSSNIKWVQGFSDSSLLLYYLTTNFNIATIHANNFSAYGMRNWHDSLKKSIDFVLNTDVPLYEESFEMYEENFKEAGDELDDYNLTKKVIYKNLYNREEEKLKGRLIGGCIDVLKVIIGTKFDNTINFCNQFEEGMLWYLENCEMSLADLYRSLWQMKEAGFFKNANGFLIGRTRANSPISYYTYEDVLHDVFDDMNVKVIYDVDFGHVSPQWTMINGSYAEFYYNNGKGNITCYLK